MSRFIGRENLRKRLVPLEGSAGRTAYDDGILRIEPDDWTVVSRVTPILAGVEDKTRPPHTASSHRLVLRGFLVMAGLEIKN